jgi:hypothetical protein
MEPVSGAIALWILSPLGSDHPDAISAQPVAAIIGDDIERNALIFFERVRVRNVADVNEHFGIAAIGRDESETAIVEVVGDYTCCHSSISLFAVLGRVPRKKHPTGSARRRPTQRMAMVSSDDGERTRRIRIQRAPRAMYGERVVPPL